MTWEKEEKTMKPRIKILLAMKGFNTGDGYMGLETVRKSL